MKDAESLAVRSERTLANLRPWLNTVLAADEALVKQNAPAPIRAFTLSEIERIVFGYVPWNSLLGDRSLLAQVAPLIVEHMSSHDVLQDCCVTETCVSRQVLTVLMLEELGLRERAASHLRSAEAAILSFSEDYGNDCFGMVWDLDRVSASMDAHYPSDHLDVVNVAESPAFLEPSDVPMVHYLQEHAKEIVAELAPLCLLAGAAAAGTRYFGLDGVVSNLAREHASWTSLPLFLSGLWNESACAAVAPRTCALLRTRPELRGALASSSDPSTYVRHTSVSVYRLRPSSRLHRHVGFQWRVNSHLGLVTPTGAIIRVWNETRAWRAGEAFAFLDAAEHEVIHEGQEDRCILNVASWHPNVLSLQASDESFREHFVDLDGLE